MFRHQGTSSYAGEESRLTQKYVFASWLPVCNFSLYYNSLTWHCFLSVLLSATLNIIWNIPFKMETKTQLLTTHLRDALPHRCVSVIRCGVQTCVSPMSGNTAWTSFNQCKQETFLFTSVYFLLSLISPQYFPDWRWLCSPGSPSSAQVEAECSTPSLLPPLESGWTWTWKLPQKRQRRTSWPATQQADSPAALPTKTQRYWWFRECIGLDQVI